MRSLGIFQAIVFVDSLMGEMAKFAETVAVNRGMPVKAFTSVDAAEQWLLTQRDGANEKNLFEEHNSRDPFRRASATGAAPDSLLVSQKRQVELAL